MTTKATTGQKAYFSAFLFILVWSKVRIRKVFYFTRWSGVNIRAKWTISTLSVACCFANVAYKNYKHMFNFVKVINRNTVSFFTSNTIKTAFLMTS